MDMDSNMDSEPNSLMGDSPYSNETYAYFLWFVLAGCLLLSAVISWTLALSNRARRSSMTAHAARTGVCHTAITVCREITYYQHKLPYFGTIPPNGTLLISGAYVGILLACLLSNIWTSIPVFWEAIALRAAYLSVAQLALLVALSARKNLIAGLLCTSHERLLDLHKLVGTCVLLTSTLHMAYFLREWLFYDVWKSQWAQMGMSMLRWGFAAWGMLVMIVFSSIWLFRRAFYQVWYTLHVASMVSFFVLLVLHLDPPYRVWAYVPISIWVLDKLTRVVSFYKKSKCTDNCLNSGRAHLQALSGGVTRITISNFSLRHVAGQFVYITLHQYGFFSHPFTIASPANSRDLVVLVKAKQGMTRSIHDESMNLLTSSNVSYPCTISGPFGGTHLAWDSFSTVVLVGGGVGASYTMNCLNSLVQSPGCCRQVKYVWIVKSIENIEWYDAMLLDCIAMAENSQMRLSCDVHVTAATRIDQSVLRRFRNKIDIHVGRPDLHTIISTQLASAEGETGIGACGPITLTCDIRKFVSEISDARATKKGSGAEAIYLHVENSI